MIGDIDAAGVLTLIALVVAIALGARGGIARSTIAALKEQNEAYERREEQHIKEEERLARERKEKDERTDAALRRLGDRNDYLEELVLRRAEGAEIVQVMKDHDSEAATRHAATIRTLREIRDAQRDRAQVETELLTAIRALIPKPETS